MTLRTKFKPNQLVHLDKDLSNSSIVQVVLQSPKLLFTRVKSTNSDYEWDAMTYRLSEL